MVARKASVLIISLWVLAILTMLAISSGQRVSLAIKLSQFERDSVKAVWLAKAGINRAIAVIDNDKNNFDALNEPWVKNEDAFRRITFNDHQDEFASVSYEVEHSGTKETVFGVVDEEGKINLKFATDKLLLELCNECDSDRTQLTELVRYILLRRSEQGVTPPGNMDPDFMKKDLANPEELLVVFEYFYRQNGYPDYKKKARALFSCIKDKVTVWGSVAKVDINTVSKEALTILLKSLADPAVPQEVSLAPALAEEITALREKNLSPNHAKAPFEKDADFATIKNSSYANLLRNLMANISYLPSNYFFIRSTGNCVKVSKNIAAVYDKGKKQIIYWHED